MAIIKCPECGKEISDKADQCINCGFPLHSINNTLYDISFNGFKDMETKFRNQLKVCVCFRNEMNIDLAAARNIVENPPQIIISGIEKKNAEWLKQVLTSYGCIIEISNSEEKTTNQINDNLSLLSANGGIVLCPRCGSNQITAGQRGFSAFTGFIGSNKTVNRCAKCGYSWKP